MDALVAALGCDGCISKSELSRKPLDHAYFPYPYLDATCLSY